MRRHRKPQEATELDITSFMNLMIILVPVLLVSMVFNQVTVLELNLPLDDEKQQQEKTGRVILLLGMGYFTWSGGAWNSAPFCLVARRNE